jgi:hypothetical protein
MSDSKRKKMIDVIGFVVVEHRTKKAAGWSLRDCNFPSSLRRALGPPIPFVPFLARIHIFLSTCDHSHTLNGGNEFQKYPLILRFCFMSKKGTREG